MEIKVLSQHKPNSMCSARNEEPAGITTCYTQLAAYVKEDSQKVAAFPSNHLIFKLSSECTKYIDRGVLFFG